MSLTTIVTLCSWHPAVKTDLFGYVTIDKNVYDRMHTEQYQKMFRIQLAHDCCDGCRERYFVEEARG